VKSDVSSEANVRELVQKAIATDLMARSADQIGITLDDLGSLVPVGRIGQATETAQVVVFLCSDAARYITGQPLAVASLHAMFDSGHTAS
jgi:NAD(P)-dependent dehydrogenase (short-subunit alcohol dehydrogenase family)